MKIFFNIKENVITKVKKIRPGIEPVKAGVQRFNRRSDRDIIKYIYLIVYIYIYIYINIYI